MALSISKNDAAGYWMPVWWTLLLGCAKRDVVEDAGPIPGLLLRADGAWRSRERLGLSAVEEPLLEAWRSNPGDPGVRWRLARVQVEQALALTDREAAAAGFAAARNFAMECVEADPSFAQTRAAEGWTAAVSGLESDRLPCAAWAGVAWTRWLATRGAAGSSLDLPAVDALLGAAAIGLQDASVGWASAILLAVRPEWDGRDLETAARQLETPRGAPNAWVHAADQLEYCLIPIGDPTRIEAICAWLAIVPPKERQTEADRAAQARGLAQCEARQPE